MTFPFNISPRRAFELIYPGGDYIKFEGTLPEQITTKADGTADVSVKDILVIERGNYLIGNSADELPQVSI